MKVKTNRNIHYTLILDEDETIWLKGLMQNPLSCSIDQENPSEDPKDKEMRQIFWGALQEAPVL